MFERSLVKGKQILLIVSLVLVTVLLAACAQPSNIENETEQTSVILTTENHLSEVMDASELKVEYIDIDKIFYNEQESYVELILKLPQINGEGDSINLINQDLMALEAFYYNELPELPNSDDYDYTQNKIKGSASGYFRSAIYEVAYAKNHLISFSAEVDGGAGGVGWTGIAGKTYDLLTGDPMLLNDFFKITSDEVKSIFIDIISKQIASTIENSTSGNPFTFESPYDDGKLSIENEFKFENYYLTEEGFVIIYPKYALSYGAAGPLKFLISFSDVKDYLKELGL